MRVGGIYVRELIELVGEIKELFPKRYLSYIFSNPTWR